MQEKGGQVRAVIPLTLGKNPLLSLSSPLALSNPLAEKSMGLRGVPPADHF